MRRSPDVRFELDARIELLSAATRLARPPRPSRGAPRLAYAEAVDRRFAGLHAHPAVGGLSDLLARGVPEPLFAEMILEQPDPRRLEADPAASRGALTQSGCAAEVHRFFADLRDLGARARFASFYKDQAPARARFVALARREAAGAQRPEELEAYLRRPFDRVYRLILSPLLPRGFYANVTRPGLELRVRSGSLGREGLTFEYGSFDSTVAHELVHTVVTPLIESSREVFDAHRLPPPADCNDPGSWSGCVEEHLVRALTLRALAVSGGKGYRALLRRNIAAGYPFLLDLCARLEVFEASSGDFASYYPRLIESCYCESTGSFGIVRL